MSEMIERVARALEATDAKALCWQHMAIAAIEAMREPTHQMVEAGATSEDAVAGSSEQCAAATFQAMIDAALRSEL